MVGIWLVGAAESLARHARDVSLHALHWCVTTLTTAGYGDVIPTTDAQKISTMVVMVLGVGVYGYMIGNMATLVANIDLAKAHCISTMERLSTFMRYRNMPLPLQATPGL